MSNAEAKGVQKAIILFSNQRFYLKQKQQTPNIMLAPQIR